MTPPIIHDQLFLQRKARLATPEDGAIVTALLATLQANEDRAAGLAANMIGQAVAIIAIKLGPLPLIMVNPTILKQADLYHTEEGCLSLRGVRQTTRYRTITVAYQDAQFHPQKQTFTDWPAQVIQHEIDHLQGILI